MSSASSPIPDSLREAVRSYLLWELGVTGAMEHFRLSNAQVHAARKLALKTRPTGSIVAAQERRDTARLRKKLVRAETDHPGILDLCLHNPMSVVGQRYGFSRARAHVVLTQLKDLAGRSRQTVEQTARLT